ncbi:MAG: sigma-54-dependent transcriptional regulator [Gammaproteobacteria bacterium]
MSPRIFFVDDEPKAGRLFTRLAASEGYDCSTFTDPYEALASFRETPADVVITDLKMPGMDGLHLLRELKSLDEHVAVLIITGYSTVDDAITALRAGATDFLKKPYDPDELLISVRRVLEHERLAAENRLLRRQLEDSRHTHGHTHGMVGESEAMREVYRLIDKVAAIRCNVIIHGESGTGKELVARAVHYCGDDADKPFIVIDCGALTDTLLESELFGHEKGAFTGADRSKQGLLEAASGGSVFLDEIGNISAGLQTKLLRVVQEQQITRVGGLRPIDIDCRFIAASNRNLAEMVSAGEFRHDLFHRLNVVQIDLPPLRDRLEDLPMLTAHFVHHFSERYDRHLSGFDIDSMQRLTAYHWPGNIRELRNLVERQVALADGPELHIETLGETIPSTETALDADNPSLEELEQRYVIKTLRRLQGNRQASAEALGINKSTLWRKLRQMDVE